MRQNEECVGNGIVIPLGQSVLLESHLYLPEIGIAMTTPAEQYKAFVTYKVVGYGSLTYDVKVGDVVEIQNHADLRPIDLMQSNSYGRMKANLSEYTIDESRLKYIVGKEQRDKLKMHAVKDDVVDAVSSLTPHESKVVDLINQNKFVNCLEYSMTDIANIAFIGSIDILRKKLMKHLEKHNVSVEDVTKLKDDVITDEFIIEYDKLINPLVESTVVLEVRV